MKKQTTKSTKGDVVCTLVAILLALVAFANVTCLEAHAATKTATNKLDSSYYEVDESWKWEE